MNIKPLFDKVVVESVDVEEKTKSGFFLPSSAQEKPDLYRRRSRSRRHHRR